MLKWAGLAFIFPARLHRPPEASAHHWRHQRHPGSILCIAFTHWSALKVQDASFHPFSHANQAEFYNKANRGAANRTGAGGRGNWRQEGGRGVSLDERSTTLVQRDGTLDGRDDTLNAMESTVRVRDASGGQQTRWPGKQDSWGGGHPVQVYSVSFFHLTSPPPL